MKFDMGDILRQVREFQARAEKIQQEIAEMEVTGEAGAGLVKVVMTGRHDIKSLVIDPTVYESGQEMLQDLIAAAVNDANRRVEKAQQEKKSEFTDGLNLPPGINLPF